MSQKVWVIPDHDWDKAPAKSRTPDYLHQNKSPIPSRPNTLPLAGKPQKNPALSFSLSMLVWGSGHLYIREYGPGSLFMTAMFIFYAMISTLVFFRDSVIRFVAAIDFPAPVIVAGAVVFFFIGLVFFLVNAVHAYYRTANQRSKPFSGVDNELWPLLCSLLFPGWGQFLNAQPKKGIFFLLFGVMGIFSVFVSSVAQYAWPVLKASPLRIAFEIYFAAALLLVPVSLLLWIAAAYDAVWSCRERIRIKMRSRLPGYRVGSHWTLRGLIPRGTAILGLLLAISVGVQFFPKEHYLDSLEKIRIQMLNSNLEILPDLVSKAIQFIDR